jgi:hypothetical protein
MKSICFAETNNLKMSISTLIHKKVLIFDKLMCDVLLIMNKLQM